MPFKVTIKNLGKLTNAEIRIGKFTVFAGPNNTGKSFVSKALYSLFGAMNTNHLAVSMGGAIGRLRRVLGQMERVEKFAESDSLQEMVRSVNNLQKTISSVSADADRDEFTAIEQALPEIFFYLDSISDAFPHLHDKANDFIKEHEGEEYEEDGEIHFHMIDEDTVTDMEKCMKALDEFKGKDAQYFIGTGLNSEATNNFLQNFQVPKISDLYDKEGEGMSFDIPEIGDIKTHNGKVVFQNYTSSGLHQLQKYSRVLYLESPVFWRIRGALNMARRHSGFFFFDKMPLLNVPKYVYDMYDNLDNKYSGDTICPDFLDRLTGKEVLGGKVVISENGEFLFQEGDNTFPLSLAAMGVANLGMLALLIERNLLDKNTFLFIDEPEAHLHPVWQVEMAEALYALSKAGVNVVIATHSSDIMKWLEVHVKKHEDAESNIELNHFRRDGIVQSNGESILDRIEAVQEELAGPYSDMFVDGM